MPRSTVSVNQAAALSAPQRIIDDKKPSEEQPKKGIRVRREVPLLKFRFVKNRFITLKELATPIIPSRPVEVVTNKGTSTVHEFDLSVIHSIELRDEEPRIRPRTDTMTDSFFEKIQDQAEKTAVENRMWNDMIRYDVASYVENGTLEIVDDPFDGREVTESEYDSAVMIHRPNNK